MELSCLQTVEDNKLMFSRREVDLADKALALHRMLGYPGFEKMSNILDNNLVHNCPLRSSDFKRALQLYGKPQAMLQGKSTRQTPKNPVPVPAEKLCTKVIESHKNVLLFADTSFVNGIPFFLTLSKDLNVRMVCDVPDRKSKSYISALSAMMSQYASRGLIVTDIKADNEFSFIDGQFENINVSIVAADAHVPEIEREIRTIKESIRCIVHGLPFFLRFY